MLSGNPRSFSVVIATGRPLILVPGSHPLPCRSDMQNERKD
jgi:hypothetical protein